MSKTRDEEYDDSSDDASDLDETQIQDESGSSEEDSDDNDAEENAEDKPEEGPSSNLRVELSKLSKEELDKIRDQVGQKAIDKILAAREGEPVAPKKRVFKRDNKNRPREMSSKHPVYERPKAFSVKKPEFRDPRFDETSGQYVDKIFKSNYQFLAEVREKEKRDLKKKLKKAKTPEEQEEIRMLLTRYENQDRETKVTQEKDAVKHKVIKKVKETTGKRFVNKSVLKKEELIEKFKKLKKSGKLDKYLEKKRKKNVSRDRRKLD
ncbi:Ribosomal RNA processing protein 36 -like protein [Halotydeus destructor]|nr:Ribosomal RNA processing protein 36 -like protein [Halotydeus destructor]